MAIEKVQCGDCLKFKVISFKEPEFEGNHCAWWTCKICGHRGPAIGRERLYTKELWEAENAHSGSAQGVGSRPGDERST
jgi:hypothetical protein